MLAELTTLITPHEVILSQKCGGETDTIQIPKVTAVEVARQIIKAYPDIALKQLFEEVENRKK